MQWHRQLIVVYALFAAACSGDAFVSADAGAPADGGGADGGAATDGGGSDGAQPNPDGGAADAAPPMHASCGTSTCNVAETCCLYTSNNAGPQYECHTLCPPPQSGYQLSELKCSGSADCLGGQVCCVERSNGRNFSVCSATPCSGNQVQLCDPSAQDAGCPSSAPCSSTNINDWNLPGSFGTCGGQTVP